ncbi:hypothetical protein TNCV_4233441 [Trichonephila clavipes]|nr:hypothetical protein TNCV_4233441 [Trichonephila clavipes]
MGCGLVADLIHPPKLLSLFNSASDKKSDTNRRRKRFLRLDINILIRQTSKLSVLQGNPAHVGIGTAYAVAKRKISNQRFVKPITPDLNCPRNLPSTTTRVISEVCVKISPDNSRFYSICRNYPQTQLTSNHIFDCKAILASCFKLDVSPQDIICSPEAPDLASLIIGAFGAI